jgi:hypothetical protein
MQAATTQVSELAQRQLTGECIDFAAGQVRCACCLALARLVVPMFKTPTIVVVPNYSAPCFIQNSIMHVLV